MMDERRVQEAIRDLPEPSPDSEFRSRLRGQFMAGEIPGTVPEAGPAKVVPLFRAAIGLLAAAALAGLFFTMNRGPEWVFVGAAGEGTISVGEVTFPIDQAADVFPSLPPGTVVRIGEGMLDLVSGNVVALQMAPGSELRVPSRPGRWIGRSIEGEVTSGEVRFVTGPDFPGRGLTIAAPGARIEVTGTTFAVICTPDSTCVCVLEGEVRMHDDDGESELVRAGMRRTIPVGSGAARDEEIFPMERSKLEMLRDQTAERFAAPPE